MPQGLRVQAIHYSLALCSSGLALVLTLGYTQLVGPTAPFILFFAAVGISTWYGGLGPGLVAIAFAVLATDYFFLPPIHTLALSKSSFLELLVFVFAALVVCWLTAALRSAYRRAEAAQRREQLARAEAEQAQQELAASKQQLQDLVGRLLVAQEEERRRVAYEVHDELAQIANAAQLHLEAFAFDYPPSSPQAQQALDRALELARRTVTDARRVVNHLRPTTLDDFGLVAALRRHIEELCAEGWQISFRETLGVERLPPVVETALFRVAQEALTNVRKHAQTTQAHLALEHRGEVVYLEVQDWGRGFSANGDKGTGAGERVGIPGMQERISWLGGQCTVESRLGSGTRVVVEVPVRGPVAGAMTNEA